MIIREATRRDIEDFMGHDDIPTNKSWICVDNGTVVCLSGLMRYDNRWFVYFEIGDAELLKRHRIAIVRYVRRIVNGYPGVLYALINVDHPRSAKWLVSLGFLPTSQTGLFRRR